ncbi:DUF724 domain-containing protein 6-like isoform X4 [Lycium barbarum]|uniref:DUF724 domain-containing protein 6-like isoform X4 n=1 Tax=Lycium barbarum TaxID=112863 RepID=UPI00293E9787|nr:DUF724 domain-containing protein 6-like isoform X4 [Lycium barbarum]
MIIEKVELKTGNASTSPTNYSPFKIGDEVEVTREEIGFTGALYEAIIVEPLKPTGSAPNLNPTPKKENKKRGFWVEYKHLLSDESESKPKREFVRKRSLLRPVPPLKYEGRRFIRVHDVVDAFYLAGWWTGVVVKVVGNGDVDGNTCRFRVAFKEPDEELEFDEHELRLHLDWVGGNNWVRPGEKMPLQLGTSSAALDHTIKETTSSNKKLEMEIRTDGVRPPKKLRSRKHRVEALENQEFPRPLVSGKAFGTRERSTVDQSAHRSLAVPPGMEKQLLESTLHDSVNQQNANQAELSSTKTSGINTSAGVSAAAVQQRAGPTTQQPKKMPNAELSSITPEPSLELPFKKNSALWREFESMEIFAKIPQNPHFSPLIQYEEKKREEVALLKMTNYAFFVERIPKLTVAELNSSDLISDMLDSIKDLEEYGFDLVPVKRHLKDLLSNNEKQTHLRNKLEEEEGKIRKCYSHKAIAKIEINKIALKIRDLEKELMSAKNVLETMDSHIKVSKSVKGAICDDLRHVERDIEGTVASVKQIFS